MGLLVRWISHRIDYPNHLHTKIRSPFSINTSQYKLTHKIWYAIVIGENQKLRTLNWLSSFPLNYSELIFSSPIIHICYLSSIGSFEYFTILCYTKAPHTQHQASILYNLEITEFLLVKMYQWHFSFVYRGLKMKYTFGYTFSRRN